MTTYSFVDIDLIFAHPEFGQYQAKGEGMGTISITFANDRTVHDVAADGHVAVSKIEAKNGTIAISMQQNSRFNQFLSNLYNYLSVATAASWALATVSVRDRINGDFINCTGVSFQKHRDIPYQKEVQTVTWNFMAAEISSSLAQSV